MNTLQSFGVHLHLSTLMVGYMFSIPLNPLFCYVHKQGRMDKLILLKAKVQYVYTTFR